MKKCIKCNTEKALEEFPKAKSCRDGRHSYCKTCMVEYRMGKYDYKLKRMTQTDTHKQCRNCEHLLSLSAFKNPKSTNCIECTKTLARARSIRRYGISLEDYDALFSKQQGRCAICNKTQTKFLAVDHDHSCCSDDATRSCGKCIRGLVCFECNIALGMVQDNVQILQAMIEYLTCETPQLATLA